ncbi:MAG: alpha/beta hydrolase [Promethearchaeota archaeon]
MNFEENVSSFELGEGSNNVILIHGYPESPYDVRLLGKYLAANGFHVFGPLLPGFGKDYEYLYKHSNWREWIKEIDNLINTIKKKELQNIFVSGISMGGFITLYTAIHHPEVKAIAPICGPVFVKSVLKYIIPLTKIFTKYVTITESEIDVMDPNIQHDPIILKLKQKHNKVVLKGVSSELTIMKKVRKNLHRITQPILICQGRNDNTIPLETPKYIYERVSSQDKTIKWYENSGHLLTLDYDKEELFEDIATFFKKYI